MLGALRVHRAGSALRQTLYALPKRAIALLSESEYLRLADATLDATSAYLEGVCDAQPPGGADCDYAGGVLTLRLGAAGTFVLNRQPPSRQLWLSSPVSGPGRYDYCRQRGEWVLLRREGAPTLRELLSRELSNILRVPISIPRPEV